MDFNIFNDLKDDQKNFVFQNSKEIKVLKNFVLHSPRENIDTISFVLQGKLVVAKYSFDGNQQIIKRLKTGETFGESLIFSGKPYPAYIIAEDDSKVLEIPKKVIFHLFEDKNFMVNYLKEISNKVLNLSNVIEILSIKPVEQRLIMYFSLLRTAQQSNIIYFKSKADIAMNIGTVREVVSKKMKLLEDKGIIKIIDKNHFKILKSL